MIKIRIKGHEESFHSNGDDSLLRAGLRAGFGLPYECSTGSCGT
ncbi:MAG: 2Fe-2S iron-sulfur cluster binding domain-containing protein, partial [Rhodospirillaceae bacterium]|nr:2Fe-2S iron-sulfur cluster binding domain-containing protein [Rhodospirillaceae bacterium]